MTRAASGAAGPIGGRRLAGLIAGGLVARLPLVMVSLSMVLLVRGAGFGYTSVGLISGAYVVATGLASPLLGRLADRVGPPRVLVGSALVSGAALVTAAVGVQRIGVAGMVAVAAVAGAATPPLTSVLRALLPRVAEPGVLQRLYGLEAAFQETLFVMGPVLVVAVVAVATPAWAVMICAVMMVVATLAFGAMAAPHAAPPAPHGRGSALRARGLRWLSLAYVGVGSCFGLLELAVIGALDERGHRDLAGLVLACWAFGSFMGGLAVARGVRAEPAARLPRLLVVLAVLSLPLALASRTPVLLAVALVVQGAAIAPTLGTIYELVPRVAPPAVLTEAFAWTTSAVFAGIAIGNVAAGAVIGSAGPAEAFLLAACGPLLMTPAAVRVRRHAADGAPRA